MNDIDQILKDRYERAYNILSGIGGGSYELIIQVAKDIKEMEEAARRASDKSDFGAVTDKEEEERRAKEAKREKEEEDAWGELDLGLPQGQKPKKVEEEI